MPTKVTKLTFKNSDLKTVITIRQEFTSNLTPDERTREHETVVEHMMLGLKNSGVYLGRIKRS